MKRIALTLFIAALAGCAVAPQRLDYSLIDPAGIDQARYSRDYNECAALADQTNIGNRAAGGAVFGALAGALIGGALCGRNCSRDLAAWGAGAGAVGGTGGGIQEQQHALRACLAGRGYRVIR